MPLSPHLADRDDLVLVVVDVQDRLAAAMEHRDAVTAAAERLVRACAIVRAPVVVTRQYPKGLGGTVEALDRALADAASETTVDVVDKTAFCACEEPAFLASLERTGRRQAAIVGMETHICVAQTALALAAAGWRVQVVEDATCSRADRDRDSALRRLAHAGVVVTTSESLMYEAVGRAGTDEFKRLLAVVKEG